MLLINANLKTMEQQDITNAYLRIQDGKIQEFGPMNQLTQTEGEDVLDVQGGFVLPGLIDAHCHLGMWEDGLGFEGDDGNEETDPIMPQVRAIDAINPMDRCFQEALESGVTTVLTGPGSANPISGTWCAIKTYGRRIDDMVLNPKIGMKFAMGENPKNVYHDKEQTPMTRMGTAALIREQLMKAKHYKKDLKRSKREEDVDPPEYDMKCEALLPVLKGKMKAFFHAHRADDIFTAIRIAKEFQLDYVIVHGTEGYQIADLLAEEHADVIAGPVICDRSKPEMRGLSIENPAILKKHGVRVALCTDHPVIPIQYLGLSGGVAVKGGMDYDDALRMLTIVPAQICGIDHRVGSIKPGKDADLVVIQGDILNVYAKPDYVILNGEVVVSPKKSK
ncbi:MAG: amidohydrolase [Massiliimalia sp.]